MADDKMRERINQTRYMLLDYLIQICERPLARMNLAYDLRLQRIYQAQMNAKNSIMSIQKDAAQGRPTVQPICEYLLNILTETLNYKQHYGTGNKYGIPIDYKVATDAQKNLIIDTHLAAMMAIHMVLQFWLKCTMMFFEGEMFHDADFAQTQLGILNSFPAPIVNLQPNIVDNRLTARRTLQNIGTEENRNIAITGLWAESDMHALIWRHYLFQVSMGRMTTAELIGNNVNSPLIQNEPIEFLNLIYDQRNHRDRLWHRFKRDYEYAADVQAINAQNMVLQHRDGGFNIQQQTETVVYRRQLEWNRRNSTAFVDVCIERKLLMEIMMVFEFTQQRAANLYNANILNILEHFNRTTPQAGDAFAAPDWPAIANVQAHPKNSLAPLNEDIRNWSETIRNINLNTVNVNQYHIPTNAYVHRQYNVQSVEGPRLLPPDNVSWWDIQRFNERNQNVPYRCRRESLFLINFHKFIKSLIDTPPTEEIRVALRTADQMVARFPATPPPMFLHPCSWRWHDAANQNWREFAHLQTYPGRTIRIDNNVQRRHVGDRIWYGLFNGVARPQPAAPQGQPARPQVGAGGGAAAAAAPAPAGGPAVGR